LRRLAAALLACALTPAAAGEPARWYVRIDNDAFFNTDRWYSSGLRLARVEARGDHEIELGLVHEIYAPEAKRYEFGVVDRAPAARLLLAADETMAGEARALAEQLDGENTRRQEEEMAILAQARRAVVRVSFSRYSSAKGRSRPSSFTARSTAASTSRSPTAVESSAARTRSEASRRAPMIRSVSSVTTQSIPAMAPSSSVSGE